MSRLEKHSDAIDAIFQIPIDPTIIEGTPDCPIVLTGFTAQEFSHFQQWLECMYVTNKMTIIYNLNILKIFSSRPWRENQLTVNDEAYLVSVLKISDQWLVAEGRKWAIKRLDQLAPPLTAPRRIELARMYEIEAWIQPAVQELLARNEAGKRIRTITDDEIIQMGAKAYSVIAKSFERLQEERVLIAYTPLPLTKSPDCNRNHDTCIKSWHDGWVTHVGRGLLSPKDAVPLSKLPNLIRGIYFTDLDYCCKIDTLSALFPSTTNADSELPKHLKPEHNIIAAATSAITTAFGLTDKDKAAGVEDDVDMAN